MSGRQVTIFGGSGFIGRHLVRRLAAMGYRIRIATRDTEVAAKLVTQGDVGQIVPVQANIRNYASVERAVAGSDIVINLVGILFARGAQKFGAVHVEGAANVARAAKAAGASVLIHMSALGADLKSDSEYLRTKGYGEEMVKKEFPAATIIRPSIVIGVDDDFFNRFAALLSLTPAFPLVDGGRTKYQPVWVNDLADALAHIARNKSSQGKLYEIGGEDVYSLQELLQMILNVTGRKCLFLPVPSAAFTVPALFAALYPGRPLITPDQLKLLKYDNVLSDAEPGLKALGIVPAAVISVVPEILDRYCR